ncbi:Aste57867_18214 [Aphanomyces stellatus]|uniref:Aste57867_18214 protein n=1 Tax=Aphanomyces stellatus TaxID=120398 RepID=A0A485LAW7_9STRA|nr:hypothetical protein As57867_018152 [Aphanomyces stellatus]VFT94952.1 Aste57867_18214 [Aphanomyces stellatus]
MDSSLVCLTCGASGERNFSNNDLGELVCNLCGTQSFQQSRNETQEQDDAIGTNNMVKRKMEIRKRKGRKQIKEKEERHLVTLDNCLHVSQRMLHMQAQALSSLVQDPDLPTTVQELWFHFLRMWDVAGSRPLLNVYLEHSQTRGADTSRLEESGYESEWNFHLKGTTNASVFSKFRYRDHLGLLYLACRIRQLGVCTGDLFFWVQTGQIPFSNLLAQLPHELQESVDPVRRYFGGTTNHTLVSASAIAMHSNYLHHHLDLKLPAFNAGLAAMNICRAFRFPDVVRTYCMHFLAKFPPSPSETLEKLPQLHHYIPCELDVVAAIIVAVKLTPGWNVWSYQDTDEMVHMFPDVDNVARAIKRKHIPLFADLCKRNMGARATLPPGFEAHVDELRRLGQDRRDVSGAYATNTVAAFAPLYDEAGVPSEPPPDDAADVNAFYPIKRGTLDAGHGAMHGPLEHLMDAVAKYMDLPPGVVQEAVEDAETRIDKRYTF